MATSRFAEQGGAVPTAPLRCPLWLWLARGLTLAALAVSGYLLSITGWDGSQVGGCGNDAVFDCDRVLSTHWSRWLGLPVSLPGGIVYAATLLALIAIGSRWPAAMRRQAWKVLLLLAVTMAGAACWFIALQGLVVGGICPFCLGAHGCGLLAAGLIFWQCPVCWRIPRKEMQEGVSIRPGTAGLLVLLGLVGPGALAAAQLLPSTTDRGVQVVARPHDNHETPKEPPGEKPPAAVLPRSTTLPRREVVELFDYTCDHCRRLHGDMKHAQKRYGAQLSVVLVPLAMCDRCNRFVQKTAPGHEQACDYARLALAVKSVDASAFAKLHEWLMEPGEVPPLTAARTYAAGLIGADVLDRAVASVQVEAELQKNIEFYGAAGQGRLPKLIAGGAIIVGQPQREELFRLLEQHAGLVPLSP